MAVVIEYINKVLALACGRRTYNYRDGVRVEDVMRNDEPGIKRRTKITLIITLIILSLFVLFLTSYLYIATNILETEHPLLKTIGIQNMSVNVYKNDTVSLIARFGLQVSFSIPKHLKAYPELGTFILSTIVNKNQTRRVFCNSKYTISKYDQLILLNFQLRSLQKKLDDQLIWIRLGGDFKILLKLARFPVFPQAHRHLYFVCDIAFGVAQLDKIYHQKCRVTSQLPSIL